MACDKYESIIWNVQVISPLNPQPVPCQLQMPEVWVHVLWNNEPQKTTEETTIWVASDE